MIDLADFECDAGSKAQTALSRTYVKVRLPGLNPILHYALIHASGGRHIQEPTAAFSSCLGIGLRDRGTGQLAALPWETGRESTLP